MTTPTLDDVIGTLSPGEILQAVGTNMHNHSPTNLIGFHAGDSDRITFQGVSPSEDGYTGGSPQSGQDYTEDYPFMMGQGLHIVTTGGGSPFWWDAPSSASHIYHSISNRFQVPTGTWPQGASNTHKYWWYSSLFINFPANEGGDVPSQIQFINQNATAGEPIPDWVTGVIPGDPIDNGDYVHFQAYFKRHGTGGPYNYYFWVDDELIISIEDTPGGVVFGVSFIEMNTNWDNEGPGFEWDQTCGCHIVSSTKQYMPCKFQVGDDSGHWLTCRPTNPDISINAISDTVGYFRIPQDLSSLDASTITRARVTNNLNETSAEFLFDGEPSEGGVMATGNKFQVFVTHLAAGVHVNALNADTDVLRVYLSNATPSASADSVKADLAEISTGNGYSGAVDIQNDATTATGVTSVAATDITITASGGAIAQFRYVVLYNDTPTSPADPLICWWDYGSAVDLASGESFDIDFGASVITLQ